MTSSRERAAQILDKAQDVLLTEGWIRGSLRTDDGYCALGAVHHAGGLHDDACLSLDGVRLAIIALDAEVTVNHGGVSVPKFNDDPRTSLDDVLDSMRHAAKGLRA